MDFFAVSLVVDIERHSDAGYVCLELLLITSCNFLHSNYMNSLKKLFLKKITATNKSAIDNCE